MRKYLIFPVCLIAMLSLGSLSAAPVRDPAKVRAFRKTHPCPKTGMLTGSCPGYVIDHIKPLCFGGADDPSNMAWEETAASYIKDNFEREACALKKQCAVK
jgi:hypothetical protein